VADLRGCRLLRQRPDPAAVRLGPPEHRSVPGISDRDGDLLLAVGNDSLWRRFAAAVGLGELGDDPRYATNPGRVQRREELLAMIGAALKSRTAADWTDVLAAAGVPSGPVQDVDQALAHPQVLAREMVVELEHRVLGSVRGLGTPIKLSGTPAQLRTASPLHGQHTEEILRGLGVEAGRIAALREKGAVA
jgi:crotonobetainyl-CoA:carnitine CoA-transferase CaiB-like acyl-CoA transferase